MIFKHWHVWQGVSCWLLSDENKKRLLNFKTLDDVVNHLFVSGERDAARYFNTKKVGE